MGLYYKDRVDLDVTGPLCADDDKCEGNQTPEHRRFSLDPQITSFEVLQNLLARAFDIRGEFTVSYLARDDEGGNAYLGLLSDWDLDAAFLSSSEPCLKLKVELKPFEQGLEEWDVVTPVDVTRTEVQTKPSFTGTLLNQMERTLTKFQKVLSLASLQDPTQGPWSGSHEPLPIKNPMGDREFRSYLDGDGRLVQSRELRHSVYLGGVEPSLRKVVWKHVLNVYPEGLSGKQRLAYMRRKSDEYQKLRSAWQDTMARGALTEEMQFVTNMVRKDVLRTDRTHRFYAGADDNANVVSLFNVLTTFALNHPSLSYCQGMSDLASPILVTMRDEAHAYVCFCALMRRLGGNFNLDGAAMTLKFQHLSELLQHFDPVFYEYLKQRGADDLLFCYRWLLLELKREFAFEDALRMLEVLWSSLPASAPEGELPLYEVAFTRDSVVAVDPQSPRAPLPRQNAYTKVCAIRKQNSAGSVHGTPTASAANEDQAGSGDESDSQGYEPLSTTITRELTMDLENLNRRISGAAFGYGGATEAPSPSTTDDQDGGWEDGELDTPGGHGDVAPRRRRSRKGRSNSESDSEESGEASRRTSNNTSEGYVSEGTTSSKEASTEALDSGVLNHSSCEEALELGRARGKGSGRLRLPRPQDLGGGNPFMMFLCLTLLVQHRDVIMRSGMDYNELAMHFDKMVRRHNLQRVLHQTRTLYNEYLSMGWPKEDLWNHPLV